ncbi:MAG: phosphopantetheine-binding protein, partial [Flammeovirgaceae bacterium]
MLHTQSSSRIGRGELEKLASLFVRGAAIKWNVLFRGEKRYTVLLPHYPFQTKRCWPVLQKQASKIKSTVELEPKLVQPAHEDPLLSTAPTGRSDIFQQFQNYFSESFDIPSAAITEQTSLYEIGLDSISIVQVRQLIKKKYAVDIP